MNTLGNRILGFLVGLVLLTGCWKISPSYGDPININAVSYERTATKVSYSGVVENGKERIDWVEGDQIRIYQRYNGNQIYADYIIQTVIENGNRSSATVIPVSEPLIYLGEGQYEYRCVYPISKGSVEWDTFRFQVDQTQSGKEADGLYMLAKATTTNPKVTLEFTPIVNAYEIRVPKDETFIHIYSKTKNLVGDIITTDGQNFNSWSGQKDVYAPVENGKAVLFTLPGLFDTEDLYLEVDSPEGVSLFPMQNARTSTFGPYAKYSVKNLTLNPVSFTSTVSGIILAIAHKQGKWWYLDNNTFKLNGYPVPMDEVFDIVYNSTEIDITGSWQFGDITASDIDTFKNVHSIHISATNLLGFETDKGDLTSLYLQSETLRNVSIHECHSLQDFVLESANTLTNIDIRNNNNLRSFTVKRPSTVFTATVFDNPELQTFKIEQTYGIQYHIVVQNCPKFVNYEVPQYSTSF